MFLQVDSLTTKQIAEFVNKEYWQHQDFWINLIIGLLGLLIGWLAYKEASKAFRQAGLATAAATATRKSSAPTAMMAAFVRATFTQRTIYRCMRPRRACRPRTARAAIASRASACRAISVSVCR